MDSVIQLVVNAYTSMTQFNYAKLDFPLYQTINATLAQNDSMAVLGAAINISLPVTGHVNGNGRCLDWERNLAAVDPFTYMVCTYFPSNGFMYSRPSSIFGAYLPDMTKKSVNSDVCQEAFGIEASVGGNDLRRKMGVDSHTLQNTPRLLLSEGLMDPVTYAGATPWLPGSDRNHSRVLYISEGVHGSDTQPTTELDPQAVVQARIYELNSMKEWLGVI